MQQAEKLGIAVAFARENPVVLNLGAYCGEDEPHFLDHTRGSLSHFMVEADERNAAVCASLESNPRVHRFVLRAAVGRTSETRSLWPCKNKIEGTSSILPPSTFLLKRCEFDEPISVQAYSLDYIYSRFRLDSIDLLWCDVQGAEREVVEGGRLCLSRTRYAFLETTRDVFYDGQAVKDEISTMMTDSGWRVIGDYTDNMLFENGAYNATVSDREAERQDV